MYAGDRFPNGSFINQMQFFNFSSRKWRIGEQHSLTLIPSARGAPATLIHGSVMLVFGGAEVIVLIILLVQRTTEKMGM